LEQPKMHSFIGFVGHAVLPQKILVMMGGFVVL
jgi:hypothetical protein